MKRFHMHLAVTDLAANIRFYSQLFGLPPTVEKSDYAKWMLDDPRINFAISSRGAKPGLDHVGIQVESEDELAALKQRYDATNADAVVTETGVGCCYVEANKHWLTDPQGVAWEAFHSLANIPTFGNGVNGVAAIGSGPDTTPGQAKSACCVPTAQPAAAAASDCKPRGKPLGIAVQAVAADKSCCG